LEPLEARKATKKKSAKPKNRSGQKPELFKAEDDWKELVDRALAKKRPAEGWPKYS